MKVGNYIMIVSGIFCIGLSMLLSGCCASCDETAIAPVNEDMAETGQVAVSIDGLDRSVEFYPIESEAASVLSLEKSSPTLINADSPFDYDLKITNLTDSAIINIIVTDTVPDDMVFIDSAYTMRRISDEQVQWEISRLEPMSSAMIETKAIANGSDSIKSSSEISYECPLCSEIKVFETQLSFLKEAPKEVLPCDRIEFEYRVTNHGMTEACDIVIKETLPEGLLTAEGGDSFEFKFESIEPGGVREFSKMVDSSATGKYVSKAVLFSSNIESLESNVTETFVAEPVLTLREVDATDDFVNAGRVFEYVITNDGEAIASNTMIMAMLPKGVQLTSASDGGKILASDARIVSWRLGKLQPKASKTVTMTVGGENEFAINPQVLAKANCAHTVAAMTLPELSELTSVSLYKPFVPE